MMALPPTSSVACGDILERPRRPVPVKRANSLRPCVKTTVCCAPLTFTLVVPLCIESPTTKEETPAPPNDEKARVPSESTAYKNAPTAAPPMPPWYLIGPPITVTSLLLARSLFPVKLGAPRNQLRFLSMRPASDVPVLKKTPPLLSPTKLLVVTRELT